MSSQANLLSEMLLLLLKLEDSRSTEDEPNKVNNIDLLTRALKTNLEVLSFEISKRTPSKTDKCSASNSQLIKHATHHQASFKMSTELVSHKKFSVHFLQCLNDLSIRSNPKAICTVKRLTTLLEGALLHHDPENLSLIRFQSNSLVFNCAAQLRFYATLYYSKNPSFPNNSTLVLQIAKFLSELLEQSSSYDLQLSEIALYHLLESLLPYLAIYEQSLNPQIGKFRIDCFLIRHIFSNLQSLQPHFCESSSFTNSQSLLLVVLQLLVNLTHSQSYITQPSLLYKHYQLSPQMIERLAITNLTSLLKAVFDQYVRNFDPSALDLILLQIYKLFDLCFVIVNTHHKEFNYMVQCLEEIQAALFKIVKQIGEENFWKFFHLVEDEISKSGRDLCTVPLVNCLVERLHFQFDSTQHCSLSRNK